MARPDADLQGWFDGLSRKVRARVSRVVKDEAEALSSAQLARLKSLEKPPDDSGALESSCRVEAGRRNDGEFVVAAGGPATTVNGYDHALGFEFGTSKQPARSFFWSTHRERAAASRQRIEDAVGDAIKS